MICVLSKTVNNVFYDIFRIHCRVYLVCQSLFVLSQNDRLDESTALFVLEPHVRCSFALDFELFNMLVQLLIFPLSSHSIVGFSITVGEMTSKKLEEDRFDVLGLHYARSAVLFRCE
jgi:hypothetical protein